jgi:SAM-dependent methyltransferase
MKWFRRHGSAELSPRSPSLDREPPGVIQKISPHDQMYEGNLEKYLGVGRSALWCIRLALLAAGKHGVERILDLPCGHGRVLRYLKAAYPDAQLTACDLDRDAVDFCARVFGAEAVYACPRVNEIRFRRTFDLIWCGSLLTHLPLDGWSAFLELAQACLEPGGLLVFTTHGRLVYRHLSEGVWSYQLTPEAATALTDGYRQTGFGYEDYAHSPGYGVSLSSPWWVVNLIESIPDLRLIGYWERGWDDHQDVVTCLRESP